MNKSQAWNGAFSKFVHEFPGATGYGAAKHATEVADAWSAVMENPKDPHPSYPSSPVPRKLKGTLDHLIAANSR